MKQKLLLKTLLLLCALVAGSSSVWADTGTLVSALNGITSGDTYYIAALNDSKYYTVPNTTIDGQTFTCAEGSLSGTTLTPATGAGEFIFTAVPEVENAFYIYNTNLKKYLVATGSKKFGYVESSSSDYGYWTFTTVGTGDFAGFSGVFSVQHSSKTHYMRAYNSTVKCYDGASNSGIYLFKKDPSNKVTTPSINGDTPFITSTEVSISCATTGATIQYSLDNGSSWTNYSTPFTLTETKTVKAKATKSGLTDSDVASKEFTKVTPLTVAEALTAINALADNGTIASQYVKGVVSTAGSLSSGKITYSISDDGTTTNELQVFSGKGLNDAYFTSAADIEVGDKVTIFGTLKKYVKNTTTTPEFDSGNYLISIIKKPTFSPAAGVVAAGTAVTISSTLDGATIYYTTDGSTPTTGSSVYSAPIIVNAAMTIKAIAVKDGYPESSVAEATYTIAAPAATPTFSVVAGAYSTAQSVTITSATEGATIYYTTDGSEPTTSSSQYSSAISLRTDKTIKAIAVKAGYANSAVAEATYTFYAALPFEYDGNGTGTLPIGFTVDGLGTYSSSPKMQFNGTGDYAILKIAETPGTLTFDIKGNSFSGGTFKVQTSADGSSYSDLATYTSLGDKQSESFINITPDVRYIKWIYTTKSSGNVALGNIKLVSTVDLKPAKEYTTLTCAKALDFTGISGLEAYIVKDNDASDGYVTLTQVNKVPANTGLVLVKTSGTTFNVPVFDGTGADDVSENKMAGSATEATAIAANGGYILSEGAFHPANAGNLPAGKAYLAISASAPILNLDFGGETTGINAVNGSEFKVNGEYYNLAGQRVAQPTKGLYIVNGKKVIIK